ncbi:MAG TPA: M28 family metallopeptidase [Dongiaceae bacterium]|nr:M28 family metallopeptidase [Dongiaceae bacterium]
MLNRKIAIYGWAGVIAAMCCAAAYPQENAAPDWNALGKAWWAHIQYLADDKLEGRGTGTEGFAKAAAYVTDQFQRAGLQPAGENGGYSQTVEFNVLRLDEEHSSLEITRDGKPVSFKFGEDGFLNPTANAAAVDAPVVFVGYGLKVPEANYDDFAGLDLRGKIVAFIAGGPKAMPVAVKAHYQSGAERRKSLAAAGAIGVISLPNPQAEEVPWSRVAGARFSERMELKAATSGAPALKFAMVVNPAHAEKLFEGSGHTFAELLASIGADKPLPHFPLAIHVKAATAQKRSEARSLNLAGVLPGSDATVKDEYVIISAHLDHLGIGQPVNGDSIYNGAMDDASGVASVIEAAKAFQRAGTKPRRSILFLTVTAEEKGLLGSEYFAAHPSVKGKIVADLNMDMYLPLFPLKYLEVQGLAESTLGEDVTAVAKDAGVIVQADKQPDHVRFIRSDQYSFIKKGVPSLAFKFGWLPGTPEEKLFNDWYKDRYHGVKDDLDQPVDFAAAAQFTAILEKLALRVANADSVPSWKADSFFRRFAKAGN